MKSYNDCEGAQDFVDDKSRFNDIKNDEYSIYHCNACRPQPACILKIGIKQIINSDHMNCVLQKGCGSVRIPCWRKRE